LAAEQPMLESFFFLWCNFWRNFIVPEQRHHITHVTSPIISPYFLTTSNSLPAITLRGDDRRVGELAQEKNDKNVQVVWWLVFWELPSRRQQHCYSHWTKGNRCELAVEPPAGRHLQSLANQLLSSGQTPAARQGIERWLLAAADEMRAEAESSAGHARLPVKMTPRALYGRPCC